MKILGIIEEDFIQYKEPSMVVMLPYCTFKCEKDAGCTGMCQNSCLVNQPKIEVSVETLIKRFMNNQITSALVLSGLEPFDSKEDIMNLIKEFRNNTESTIVIYSGYNKDEIDEEVIQELHNLENIIIKFGRYVPNQNKRFDEVLGVYLASDNQYAERI